MWAKRAVLAAVLGSAAAASGCCECCNWCVGDRAPAKYSPQEPAPNAATTAPAAPGSTTAPTTTGAYGGTGN